MNSAIFNFTILVSGSAMLESDTLLSSLRFTQKHSSSTLTLPQTNSIWFKLIHSHSTWLWQPSWFLPSWTWPSWNRPSQFFLSKSLTLAKIGSHHLHKKTFTHSFSLNLMLTAILNSAMLDSDTDILVSDTLLSSLRFTQKHSPSTLTLTQTNSIWLKLIHSHLIDDGSHLEFCHLGFSFCIVEFRHLVYFSQIHSKTLSLQSDSDLN